VQPLNVNLTLSPRRKRLSGERFEMLVLPRASRSMLQQWTALRLSNFSSDLSFCNVTDLNFAAVLSLYCESLTDDD
jgi:hypothetical protein